MGGGFHQQPHTAFKESSKWAEAFISNNTQHSRGVLVGRRIPLVPSRRIQGEFYLGGGL